MATLTEMLPDQRLPVASPQECCSLPTSNLTSIERLPSRKHLFIVSGPAGCGKTTVASHISQELGVPYLEGDDYHSETNRLKMSGGQPLDDADRWEWLATLRNEAIRSASSPSAVLVTCSALKRSYRDVFRMASNANVQVHFLYLMTDEEALLARLKARKNHYMKESMLKSQLEILEVPGEDEEDVIRVSLQQDRASINRSALESVQAALLE